MTKYLLAVGIVFALMLGWVAMQEMARWFARRHPVFGPPREGLGCGSSCNCSSKNCGKRGG